MSPNAYCISRFHFEALWALPLIALLTGCTTGAHWRMDRAQPHPLPPSSSFSSSSPSSPVPLSEPWWENYRPLLPKGHDTCALMQESAQVEENLRLAPGRGLSPQHAISLWTWLARTPLPLRTFAPRLVAAPCRVARPAGTLLRVAPLVRAVPCARRHAA